MASRAVNIGAARGRGASTLGLNIQRFISNSFSSHSPHQGVSVEDDDVRKIRKSLDNDDGKDYAEDDAGGRGVGDVAEKAIKGTKDTVFNAGVSVAEGVEHTLETLKETTEKVKEEVLDDDHHKPPDDRLRNNNSGDT